MKRGLPSPHRFRSALCSLLPHGMSQPLQSPSQLKFNQQQPRRKHPTVLPQKMGHLQHRGGAMGYTSAKGTGQWHQGGRNGDTGERKGKP